MWFRINRGYGWFLVATMAAGFAGGLLAGAAWRTVLVVVLALAPLCALLFWWLWARA
jgi:hypothetical protein